MHISSNQICFRNDLKWKPYSIHLNQIAIFLSFARSVIDFK